LEEKFFNIILTYLNIRTMLNELIKTQTQLRNYKNQVFYYCSEAIEIILKIYENLGLNVEEKNILTLMDNINENIFEMKERLQKICDNLNINYNNDDRVLFLILKTCKETENY
ncbi:33018_t:CDS:1, partial [Racocetra persica]